ncbi:MULTISPECIES: acyl-CoA dehydrogenase family protein [Metabacillus]|uniref:Acyl-CoA dehydrogenase family protein n=1 Tax=Metabacillus endolithicus TaxID=1535204 RepID=A0ABW5BW39_9BACI|nr:MULTISPECIES: acyl-CoA dehydrogenase family protein [Metabacillus]UGB32405.1 acyl-CoA dehydrogenase family protein [Metabacillus sp. B2-18]UPG63031.1 acyl-CoA dehydrogenase family protein [Metabacillus endolithicus]
MTLLANKGGSFLYDYDLPLNLFTPEDVTDEQKMIEKTAKQFVEKDVTPVRERIENQDFDKVVELLKKAGELGLLAHSVPEQYGGLGLDKVSKGIVGEVVGRSGGYGVAHSNHTCIATLPITYFGTKQQKERYLPKLASGEYLGAYCLTEPNAGSDALASQTTAKLNDQGTHYLLNGTKLYITNAIFSDTFIVYAKVDGDKFSAFIVEKNYPGISLGPEEQKMGIKGSSTRAVILEDCLVPKENLLGEIGKGHVIALNVLNLGRFNLGSACVGGAKYALELALSYTKQRIQFGKSIADFPATKEKIALMSARIFAAESIQYRTAGLLEEILGNITEDEDITAIGKKLMEYATECAICKVYGSETLDSVSDEALQLHGGAGFIKEYTIEQVYRDSRINRIFEGTNEINRLLLPTHLFRKALKGEIPLEEMIQTAIQNLAVNPSQDNGEFSQEKAAISAMRNVFLACIGAVYEQFGEKLFDEQETLMKLSNIAIELYAAESTLARSIKRDDRLKRLLARTVLEQSLLSVEVMSRQLVNGVVNGKKRSLFIQMITSHLQSVDVTSTVEEKREIARAQFEAERFVTK